MLTEERFPASLFIHDIVGKKKCEVWFLPLTPWLHPLLTWQNDASIQTSLTDELYFCEKERIPVWRSGQSIAAHTLLHREQDKQEEERERFPQKFGPQDALNERMGIC